MKSGIVAISMLFAVAVNTNVALALPSLSTAGAVSAPTNVTTVDYRGYRGGYRGYGGGYRGYRGGYYRNRGIGIGIAAAIIGGVALSEAARADGYGYSRYRGEGSGSRCANTYRSFDPASGTYMGYDGVRHVCPYL